MVRMTLSARSKVTHRSFIPEGYIRCNPTQDTKMPTPFTLADAYGFASWRLANIGFSLTADQVREVHEAMRAGAELPHGRAGWHAAGELEEPGGALDRLSGD